jgi:hypothetical protein
MVWRDLRFVKDFFWVDFFRALAFLRGALFDDRFGFRVTGLRERLPNMKTAAISVMADTNNNRSTVSIMYPLLTIIR